MNIFKLEICRHICFASLQIHVISYTVLTFIFFDKIDKGGLFEFGIRNIAL